MDSLSFTLRLGYRPYLGLCKLGARMKIVTPSNEVFACWSKACAPPPAGKGGSAKGGPWSNKQRVARAKAAGEPVSQGKTYGRKSKSGKPGKEYWNLPEEERRRRDHADIVKAGKKAVARWESSKKAPKRGNVDENPGTAYDKYRAAKKGGSPK